jgi:hypothetical protein
MILYIWGMIMMFQTSHKYHVEINKNFSVFDLIIEQRKTSMRRERRRILMQNMLGIVKTLTMIAIGVWCYMSHCTIIAYATTLLERLQ